MPVHIERRQVPYSRQQMFNLVLDVESYPAFVPHMLASRIERRIGNTVQVEMLLGFGPLRRRIRSSAILSPPRQIEIFSHDPPLRGFHLRWTFEPAGSSASVIELRAEFEVRSPWLQRFLAPYFKAEVAAMTNAFERRAAHLHRHSE